MQIRLLKDITSPIGVIAANRDEMIEILAFFAELGWKNNHIRNFKELMQVLDDRISPDGWNTVYVCVEPGFDIYFIDNGKLTKKQLMPWSKFKSQYTQIVSGQSYFYIDFSTLEVKLDMWTDDNIDQIRLEFGNVFSNDGDANKKLAEVVYNLRGAGHEIKINF